MVDPGDLPMFPKRFNKLRTIRWVILVATTVGGIAVGVSWWMVGRLVSPAPRIIGTPPADLDVEPVFIVSHSES